MNSVSTETPLNSHLNISWKHHLLAVLAVCTLGIAIYFDTLESPFVFDDVPNILQNEHLQITSLEPSQLKDAAFGWKGKRRPVAYLSFGLNHYFGDGHDLPGYHATNIAIHLINGLLVYFLVWFTAGQLARIDSKFATKFDQPTCLAMALVAAGLFVAHPMQTQAVTYLVQRMTSLATMFYLLGFLAYLYGRTSISQATRWGLWSGTLLAWILGMGTKEITVTLPVVILLYEWFFFQDMNAQWLKRCLAYVLLPLSVALGLVILIYLDWAPIDQILDGYNKRDFTLTERLMTQPRVIFLYLSLLLFPSPSRLNLLHHIETSKSLFDPTIATLYSILGIVALLGLAVYLARRQRLVSFCILWFFINLVIESSVIALEMVFEHRVYLPMFSIAMLASYLLFSLLARRKTIAIGIAIVVILSLGVASRARNHHWQDIYTDVIVKNPKSSRSFSNRGLIRYRDQGELDLALQDFTTAIELDPNSEEALCNRGFLYLEKKQLDLAMDDFSKSIEFSGGRPYPYADPYTGRGRVHAQLGLYKLALAEYQKALEIDFQHMATRLELAWLKSTCPDKRYRDGDKALQYALAGTRRTEFLDTRWLQALAFAHAERGHFDEAILVQQRLIQVAQDESEKQVALDILNKNFRQNKPVRIRKTLR